ncbi:hypothetical protein D9M72_573400 [compost metagenome]
MNDLGISISTGDEGIMDFTPEQIRQTIASTTSWIAEKEAEGDSHAVYRLTGMRDALVQKLKDAGYSA